MPDSRCPKDVHPSLLRMAVVGAGALGSTLLEGLARERVAHVLVIDPDAVEERNLQMSSFLQRSSRHMAEVDGVTPSGNNKAHLLAKEAAESHALPWRAMPCEVADVGWGDLLDVDVIGCCTDSALSRAETAFIARMLRKPLLDGAVFGDGIAGGRVSAFPALSTAACYLCGMTEDRRANVLGYAASGSLGCRLPPDVPSMTGTLQTLQHVAEKMLETLLRFAETRVWDEHSYARRMSLHATQGGNSCWREERIALTRSASCPWHEDVPRPLERLPWTTAFSQSLPSATCEVQLSWPICTEAVCAACGARSQPMRRVAAVRRTACCERCGAQQLQPLRTVHRIRTADWAAHLSPQELGLPERHLYWIQDTAV